MNGIIIINKPKDYTSFDVVAIIKKLLKEKKVGHTGTLDPMATGVLPILIGRATKLQPFISSSNKEYVANFKLGVTTNTLDITGEVLSSVVSNVKKCEIEEILDEFRGEINQVPPMFSAVQKDGVRLYKLARKGIEISRDTRKVTINKLVLINFEENSQSGTFVINCSKGTYIRSLCDDIGKRLKSGAVLTALQRTNTHNFNIRDSLTLEEAIRFAENDTLAKKIIPFDIVLKNYTKINISSLQAIRFKNGGHLNLDRISTKKKLKDGELVRIYNNGSNFIGLGKINLEKNKVTVECLIEI